MEKDIEKIKEQLEKFIETYNVTVDIKTIWEGRTIYGKIISPKVEITINSWG